MLIHDNVSNDASQHKECYSRDDDQGGSLSHISNAPLYEVGISQFTVVGILSNREYAALHSAVVRPNASKSVMRK
jgi:hypothetical protein